MGRLSKRVSATQYFTYHSPRPNPAAENAPLDLPTRRQAWTRFCGRADTTLVASSPRDNAATMSQVWSGNITTDSATCILGNAPHLIHLCYIYTDYPTDVRISVPSSSSKPNPLPQDAKLHFLSLVEVSRIPLYLAIGPSCDVSTGDEATTRWLTEALLKYEECDRHGNGSREPWWLQVGSQSENGILLGVEAQNEECRMQNVATEVLVYAAVTQNFTALPTPPRSSSPAPPDGDTANNLSKAEPLVKVYALPLCSNIIGRAEAFTGSSPPIPTDPPSAGQAYFLPHVHDPPPVTQPPPQKRPSISMLFDDATKKRKKTRGRGGESISQAMAGIDRPASQHGLPENQGIPQPQQIDLRRKSLSRAPSMAPVASSVSSRPTSRSGALTNGKRSSLHRMESAITHHDSPALSDADGSCSQENKAALTKVVMAGMRLHGLQQKKKPLNKSQGPSQMILNTETDAVVNEAEDEYKLVYHQTFKAATFIFRKHLNAHLVSQETMRDVVDRLLTMFCTDPMTVDDAPDVSESQGFETNVGLPSSSPFDKPSSQARSSNVANGWNTPMVKKR